MFGALTSGVNLAFCVQRVCGGNSTPRFLRSPCRRPCEVCEGGTSDAVPAVLTLIMLLATGAGMFWALTRGGDERKRAAVGGTKVNVVMSFGSANGGHAFAKAVKTTICSEPGQ